MLDSIQMKKRVFIIHGWGGRPGKGWLLWLRKELTKKGFEVHSLEMPDKDAPVIAKWLDFLKLTVNPDGNTYFVGHSIGCQAIIRYLETLDSKSKVGGAVFVAGWFTLTGMESKEEEEIAKPWLKTKINLKKVRQRMKQSIALFSDNDPYVPLENVKTFREDLGSRIIIEKEKGHYIEHDTEQIPIVLKELMEMAK